MALYKFRIIIIIIIIIIGTGTAALCHKRGTSAIRLPGATSIFNAELHAILLALDVVRRSKEKHFLLLSDSYSSLIALGGSHVHQDTIDK